MECGPAVVVAGLVPGGGQLACRHSVGVRCLPAGRVSARFRYSASCASGVTSVNIDNSYGLATSAIRDWANMMRRRGGGVGSDSAETKIKKRQTLAIRLYGQVLEQICVERNSHKGEGNATFEQPDRLCLALSAPRGLRERCAVAGDGVEHGDAWPSFVRGGPSEKAD